MKRLSIWLIPGLLLALVSCNSPDDGGTVPSQDPWLVGEGLRYGPQAISEDKLVFLETISGGDGIAEQHITLYNLDTREKERLVTLSGDLFVDAPAIDGDRIVWSSANRTGVDTFYGLENGDWNVYLLDLKTHQVRQITSEPHAQMGARISGNNIVWLDARHVQDPKNYPARFDLYAYNLESGAEKRLTSGTTVDGYASPLIDVSGSLVVWTDVRHADPSVKSYPSNSQDYDNEIYAYDLASDQEKRLTAIPGNDYFPAIDGNRIAWPRRSGLREADIFLLDLDSGEKRQISQSGYAGEGCDILGDRIVWPDSRVSEGNTSVDAGEAIEGSNTVRFGRSEIYMFDFNAGKEILIVPSIEHRSIPQSGNQVFISGDVWMEPVLSDNFVVYTKVTGIQAYLYAERLGEVSP